MKLLSSIYRKVKKKEPPYYYNYSIFKIIIKPIRKKITNVWAANCPFNCIRILLYRMCGFKIGKNTFIGMRCYLDDMHPKKLIIEDNVTISYGVFFACHGKRQQASNIFVKEGAYIGMNASVISKSEDGKGVTIGEHAMIGACTLVNKNIPAYATAVGVPCRIIENTDECPVTP